MAARTGSPLDGAHRFLAVVLVLVSTLAACGTPAPLAESRPEGTVAFLRSVRAPDGGPQSAFVEELARRGYHQGDNLELLAADPAEVHTDPADITATVDRWVVAGVDVIVALSTSSAMAAAKAAPETSVLFLSNDPLATGLIDNEVEPEGHLTGVTFRVPADRTLSLATRAVVGLDRLGLLFPETDPAAAPIADGVAQAASELDLALSAEAFKGDADVGSAFTTLRTEGADALLLANAPAMVRALPALEVANRGDDALPVIANTRAVEHALMILEPHSEGLYRQLGAQAARLLDGIPVSEIPVEDPGSFRLVLNQRVAGEFGIELPADLLAEADEVIP